MNRKQIICMWLGIATFVFFGVIAGSEEGAGLPGVIIFWICVIVVTGGLIYTFRDKNDKTNKKD
jgi:hypothetical protein